MRLICCLDTNAVLDVCYRYYPSDSFSSLWSSLEDAVIAGQICFVLSEHINLEVVRKIHDFDYPKANYDKLLKALNVEIIKVDVYFETLNKLKSSLMIDIPFINRKNSPASFLEGLTEDLSNIAVAQVKKAKVITSEQGSNRDIKNPHLSKKTTLKIPDTCEYMNIPCSNWLEVFSFLGMKF